MEIIYDNNDRPLTILLFKLDIIEASKHKDIVNMTYHDFLRPGFNMWYINGARRILFFDGNKVKVIKDSYNPVNIGITYKLSYSVFETENTLNMDNIERCLTILNDN